MLAIASTPESMPEYFWIAASTSLAVDTTGNTSRPGVRHRNQETAVAFPDRQRTVSARQRFREQGGHHRIDLEVPEVDELEAHLFGERPHEIGLLDHAEVDQDATQRLRRLAVLLEGSLQLLGRDVAEFDQDLPELFRLPLDLRHRVPGVRSG
jgi:hypothetical protein